jgi:hypothetical protein
MSTYRRATVTGLKAWGEGIAQADVELEDGGSASAIVLESLVGDVKDGDLVVLNTTAVDLGLGSGGYHFVLWNLARRSLETGGDGHIMKLRYTPLQFNIRAAEEEMGGEPGEDLSDSLQGAPVIAGSVHSQLLPAAVAYRSQRPGGRLIYVMTDGGALPASFSRTVRFLRESGYLSSVITCGNAFGGDREAVTLFGALVAAVRLDGADAIIALMGPGIAGTGSAVGFTGMEQGTVVNAASKLGGFPIAIPRITFADARARHAGLSHHTVAALKYGASVRSTIAIPMMNDDRRKKVFEALEAGGLDQAHDIREVDASGVIALIDECGFCPTVMGRGPELEPEFFMAAGAAGLIAAEHGGG